MCRWRQLKFPADRFIRNLISSHQLEVLPQVDARQLRHCGGEAGKLILAALPKIAARLNAGLASSAGAEVLSDGVHMTTASHDMLGRRMAAEYLKLK